MTGVLIALACMLAAFCGAVMHFWYKFRCEQLERRPAFDPDEVLRLDALSILGIIVAAAGVVGLVIYLAVLW